MSTVTIRRALISVSDKTGLAEFAKALHKYKVEILSTGGTLKALKAEGIPAIAMEEFTGFPEILEGRVKTLHPKIHGGLLYRRDKKSHVEEAGKHKILPIDLVVVNLYPFEQVIQKEGVDFETAIENIDIGGPSMLRSAAKNFHAVTVVSDPTDYAEVIQEMKKNQGGTTIELREKLAQKVFLKTSTYDHAIAGYLGRQTAKQEPGGLPFRLDGIYDKVCDLRYGENPHQRAAFYQRVDKPPRFKFEQLHGKELSYNNYLDIEATIDVLREFTEAAACVVKHSNPCGIAENAAITQAVTLAVECDAMSAFGGIVGINRPCDKATAQETLDKLKFFEVFVAPSFDSAALKLLKERKNLRLIATGDLEHGGPYDLRFIKGGILLQDRDQPTPVYLAELKKSLNGVTEAKISEAEIEALIFAWKCVKVVKSNAIVIAQGRQTVGIGAGQMSRVDSVEIACRKAGYRTDGGFMASDAFFPMPDSIEEAARYKIKAIIQPGGSIRDSDVINACNRFGIAMVFTGKRHFRH
ncbi:MAG: bifunctional phosphoribosylaminoimidazolecarboxamide formyltransferase/IMP cyclohydrolase [Candidatus Omnitrophica bacterium]|nr:bifunctional phosphoribosylaminoimidazolecarboxamide formyltransferase/IMP cyclohydrolase [Candidatus Omnitrophota bacterium]